jgi:hypothetical protein
MKLPFREGRRALMSVRLVALLAVVLFVPARSVAGLASPQALLDSARVAREAWRDGSLAARRGELAVAQAHLRRAMEAWPGQAVYALGYATLAARSHDTAAVVTALSLFADLGGGNDLSASTDLAPLRNAPAVRSAAARIAANARPIAGSRVAFDIEEPDFWPEGLAHDPRTGAWYLGSVRHGKILRVRPGETPEVLVHPRQDGLWGVFGMRVDTVANTLWVTSAAIPQMAGFTPADSGRSGVFAFDLSTGRLRGRWLIADRSAEHLLGDLVLTAEGDVYATDSQDPVIWRVRRGSDRIEEFLRHPLFRSLQGPALDERERTLFVADYSHGILAVDLVTRQTHDLPFPPRSTTLGIDGLLWENGSLLGIQNGITPARVVRLHLDAARGRIAGVEVLDRQPQLADEPTMGLVHDGALYYVGNSQWEKYDAAGRLREGVRLAGPRILALPLK